MSPTVSSANDHRRLSDAEAAPPPPPVQREPSFICTGECEGDCIPSIAFCILFALYGTVTCCECCSGDCLDICSYQCLPICQNPLEPNKDMDSLPETSPEEIQNKLLAAQDQLDQLDQTLNSRRKTHRVASTLLCPFVFVPRTITAFFRVDDDDYQPQSRRPYPLTQLDLVYQFTLPLLEQNKERGRHGLRQFLSPPEVQRMIDLETTIIPNLEAKAAIQTSPS